MKSHIVAAFITALVLSVPAFSYTKSVDKSTQLTTTLLAKSSYQQQSKNVKEVIKPTILSGTMLAKRI